MEKPQWRFCTGKLERAIPQCHQIVGKCDQCQQMDCG